MNNTQSNLLANLFKRAASQFCKTINKCHLDGRSSVPWKTWSRNNSITIGAISEISHSQVLFCEKDLIGNHLWCCHQVFNVLSKHLVFTPQSQVFLFHPIHSAAQLFQCALKLQHLDSNIKLALIKVCIRESHLVTSPQKQYTLTVCGV